MRLIDADALVKELSGKYIIVPADEAARGVADFMGIQTRQAINNAPTIEAVPLEDYRSMEQTVHKLTQALAEAEPVKHGRWLPYDKGDCTYICSECGFVRDAYVLEEKAFCPHCGAKMDEPEAEP